MKDGITVNILASNVKFGVFDQNVKDLAILINHSDWKEFEFIRILGGGNVEFPKQVIELAREKLYKELPEYKGIYDGNNNESRN